MRRSTGIALIAVTALTAASGAHASGLLGERYVNALVGQVHTGDEHLQDYDDTYLATEAKLNVPVAEHVDLGFRYGRESLDGSHQGTELEETEALYLGEATYHFRPENHRYNPFLRARAGADLGIGEHAAIAPEVAYRWVDGDGQLLAGAEANYWLGERAFLLAKAEYRGEEGDFGYFAGGGYHF